MPTPKAGESQKEFISRCIPYLIREGKHPNNPKGRKAAAGECYGIWRSSKKSEEKIPVKSGLKDKLGYFCRLEGSENKYYYEIDNEEMKNAAKQKAEEEWILMQVEQLTKDYEENLPKETPIKRENLRKGDVVVYKGKTAKILKVLEK